MPDDLEEEKLPYQPVATEEQTVVSSGQSTIKAKRKAKAETKNKIKYKPVTKIKDVIKAEDGPQSDDADEDDPLSMSNLQKEKAFIFKLGDPKSSMHQLPMTTLPFSGTQPHGLTIGDMGAFSYHP